HRYHHTVRVLRTHQDGAGGHDPAGVVELQYRSVDLRLLEDRLRSGVRGVLHRPLGGRDGVLVGTDGQGAELRRLHRREVQDLLELQLVQRLSEVLADREVSSGRTRLDLAGGRGMDAGGRRHYSGERRGDEPDSAYAHPYSLRETHPYAPPE